MELVTHCKKGHEFTDANTYWRSNRGKYIQRLCKICDEARKERWRNNHPEKALAIKLSWESRNIEWRQKWVQGFRAMTLAKKEKIAGRPRPLHCELCSAGGKIVFDHCHESGKFRGWLCNSCNVVLGLAGDSPEILRKLADYLESHNGKTNSRCA